MHNASTDAAPLPKVENRGRVPSLFLGAKVALLFQLHKSSQFYPEWRASAAARTPTIEFGIFDEQIDRPVGDAKANHVTVANQAKWPAHGRFRCDVQNDRSECRTAHASV